MPDDFLATQQIRNDIGGLHGIPSMPTTRSHDADREIRKPRTLIDIPSEGSRHPSDISHQKASSSRHKSQDKKRARSSLPRQETAFKDNLNDKRSFDSIAYHPDGRLTHAEEPLGTARRSGSSFPSKKRSSTTRNQSSQRRESRSPSVGEAHPIQSSRSPITDKGKGKARDVSPLPRRSARSTSQSRAPQQRLSRFTMIATLKSQAAMYRKG